MEERYLRIEIIILSFHRLEAKDISLVNVREAEGLLVYMKLD